MSDSRQAERHPLATAAFTLVVLVTGLYAAIVLAGAVRWIDRPFPGFKVTNEGAIVAQLPASWNGTKAGLKTYDRLLTVDGHPFTNGAEFYREVESKPIGTPIAYTIEHVTWGGQISTVHRVVATQRYELPDWIAFTMGYWLTGVFYLLIGAVVSLLKPGSLVARAHFALCLAASINFLNIFDWSSTHVLPSALINFHRFAQGAAGISLVLVFPRRLADRGLPWLFGGNLALGLGILAFSLANYQVASLRPWTHMGTSLYSALAGLLVVLVPLWAVYSKSSTPRQRAQAKIIVAGAAMALLPMLVMFLGPLFKYEGPLLSLGSVCGVLLPLSIAYAIVRHQLFDIDLLLRPSLTYTLLSVILVSVYLLASGMISALVGEASPFASIMATAIVAAVVAPARDRVKALLDRTFFRAAYSSEHVLAGFALRAHETASRAEVAAACLAQIDEALHPSFAAVYRAHLPTGRWAHEAELGAVPQGLDPQQLAEEADILRVPIKEQGAVVGWIVLGPKKSELPFAERDRRLVAGLSQQLAIWLRFFDRLEKEQAQAHQMERLRASQAFQDQFLNMVSHELRSPVSVILAAVSYLRLGGEQLDALTRETCHDRIYRNSESLSILLDDLLNAGQLQSGRFALMPVPLEVRPLVEEVLEDLRPLAHEKGQELAMEGTTEPIILQADPVRLGQVLRNLLSNAIKYAPAKTAIRLRYRTTPDALRCEVEDQGLGIAQEDQSRLFQRFGLLDPQARSESGVGLGLYIVRAIVEAHGGEVGVQSEQGRGATFWFEIPLAPVAPLPPHRDPEARGVT